MEEKITMARANVGFVNREVAFASERNHRMSVFEDFSDEFFCTSPFLTKDTVGVCELVVQQERAPWPECLSNPDFSSCELLTLGTLRNHPVPQFPHV